jgi:hypothetical protein
MDSLFVDETKDMNKKIVFLAAVMLVAIFCLWYFARSRSVSSGVVACTQEAMQCPDGSYVGRTGPNCEFTPCPSASTPIIVASTSTVDMSDWKTYTNNQYGLSLKYPADWDLSDNGIANSITSTSSSPFFELYPNGNRSYLVVVSILDNPSILSSGDFVADFIAKAKIADQQAEANHEPDDNAPRFDKEYATTVASYPAWELYNVFEYDQGGEQIYVAHNGETLEFDFPVPDVNGNIVSPAENNAVAHRIINTLVFVD